MLKTMKAALFDLDGVIVDTAKYHYRAWKRLAETLGVEFTERDNERLKGVSRIRSLEIILEIGGIVKTESEKAALAELKNEWYVGMIARMDASEALPGAVAYLEELRRTGVKTALGSASRNACTILDRLRIRNLFDSIVDGTRVKNTKPDPEVFLLGASDLGMRPVDCVVFEDAFAGIEAAKRAGMYAVGIGDPAVLTNADIVVSGLAVLL